MTHKIHVHNILLVFRSLHPFPFPSSGHSCPRKRPLQQLIEISARMEAVEIWPEDLRALVPAVSHRCDVGVAHECLADVVEAVL
jgi:hypothetical protein